MNFKTFLEGAYDYDGGLLIFSYSGFMDKMKNRVIKNKLPTLIKKYNRMFDNDGSIKKYKTNEIYKYTISTGLISKALESDEGEIFNKKSIGINIDDINAVGFQEFVDFIRSERLIDKNEKVLMIHRTMHTHRFI